MDNIKILRVIEYSGPRDLVEEQVRRSLHGEKIVRPHKETREFTIRVVTLGFIPEIFEGLESRTLGDDSYVEDGGANA